MISFARRLRQTIKARRRARELSSELRAGAHSRREIRRLRNQWLRRGWRVIAIVMMLAGLAAFGSHLFLPEGATPYAVGAVLASGLWLVYVLMLQTGGVMSHVVGVMGEQWTADELRKLRRRGWRFVNHVMLEHVDVDHVLLGPGGLLCLETKFRSDWASVPNADHVSWAARARVSARKLQSRMYTDRPIRPIVVIWGPGAGEAYPSPFEVDGVTFCLGRGLVEYVSSLAATVSQDEIEEAFGHLDAYLRKRDRGEQAAHGQPPRRVSQYYNDFTLATLSATATMWLVAATFRLPPGGLWYVVTSLLVVAGAATARRRLSPNQRTRAITTALIATGVALLALLGALAIVNLIRR